MKAVLTLGLLCSCFIASNAQAAGYFGPNPHTTPSVFTYAYRGFALGAIDGLAGGYLVARNDGFGGDDWKPLVYGVGFGALGGSVLGFTLGFVDLAVAHPGRGNIALRDMVYGAGFGTLTGAVIGGLVVIKSHDAEHIPFGAAIGALAGTGAGLIIGLIEGRRITESPAHRYRGQRESRVQLALGAVNDIGRRQVWTGGVSGRF